MQSLIAFCSLCLQLSNLASQNAEFLLKRDEACTLCLTDLLQPTNLTAHKSSSEILHDGLYFNNPLLKEALKSKIEQQFLFQSNDCPDLDSELASKGASLIQAEELIKSLTETIQKLPSSKADVKGRLERQRDAIVNKASSDMPNKQLWRGSRNDFTSSLDKILSTFLEKILPEQLERKISEFSEQYLDDLQDLNQKIQNLKDKIRESHFPQETIPEISLLYNQAIVKLEQQSHTQHKLDQDAILDDFEQRLKDITDPLQDYLKPIKTSLKAGEKLAAKERISSENGIFSLAMGDDWSVTLYKFYDIVIWNSGKVSAPSRTPPQLFFDPEDGVLKIQGKDPTVILKELNPRNPNYRGIGAYLTITNAGEIKILEEGVKLWTPLYSLPAPKYFPGTFTPGNVILSENEAFTFALEKDCNLVLYEGAKPIWQKSALTDSNRARNYCNLYLDRDGFLEPSSKISSERAIIHPHHRRVNEERATLVVGNDGVITISSGDQELWTSKL